MSAYTVDIAARGLASSLSGLGYTPKKSNGDPWGPRVALGVHESVYADDGYSDYTATATLDSSWSGEIVWDVGGVRKAASSFSQLEAIPSVPPTIASVSRMVARGATDQTLSVYLADADWNPVDVDSDSPGLALSIRADIGGRRGISTPLSPVSRSAPGVHTDGAVTSLGSGEVEIDLPDSFYATSDVVLVVELQADGVSYVMSEQVLVQTSLTAQNVASEIVTSVGAQSVTVLSPVDPRTGAVSLVTGDDYNAASAKKLTFSKTGSFPDLTGATITMTVRHKKVSELTIVGTGELVSQDSDGISILVSVPRTETSKGRDYFGDSWNYDIKAVLPDGTTTTLFGPGGKANILQDQTQ